MSAMNMKEALAKARRLRCRVTMVKRTGEWRVAHPDDPSVTVTCSNHRKDAPRHLLVLLKTVERDAEDARFKASKELLLAALKDLPSPEHANPGFIQKPIIKPVVIVKTAAIGTTEAPATQSAPPSPEPHKEVVVNATPSAHAQPRFKYKPELDAYVLDYIARNGMRRGTSPRLYTAIHEHRPELLVDLTGREIKEGTFAQHIAALAAHKPRQVVVAPSDLELARERDEAVRDARQATALLEARGGTIGRLNDTITFGSQALEIVAKLIANNDAPTLQTIIELAKS